MNRIKKISLLSCAVLLVSANASFPAYAAQSKATTSRPISTISSTGENIGLTPIEPGTSSGVVPFGTEVPTKLWDVSKSYYYLSGKSNTGKLYTEYAFYNKYSYSVQIHNQSTSTLTVKVRSLSSKTVYNTVSIPGNSERSFTVTGTSLDSKIYLEFSTNVLGYIDVIGTIE